MFEKLVELIIYKDSWFVVGRRSIDFLARCDLDNQFVVGLIPDAISNKEEKR